MAILPLLASCTSGSSDPNTSTSAGDYPNDCRSIEIIVGFSAGGATDLAFRVLADELKERLGKDVQVINAPGGGGVTSINRMLAAKADGCTLGHSSIPSHLSYLFPESEANYAPEDFSFAGAFGLGPQVLVVAADSPVQSVDELLASAQNGRLIAVADSPKGGDAIINAQFASVTGVGIQQVVVDGSAEKVTAVLSRQVDFSNGALGGIIASVQSGQLRALAVWSEERVPELPDVPTAQELGYDVVASTIQALSMSKDVPEPVRQKLEDTLRDICADSGFAAQLLNVGYQSSFLSGSEYRSTWADMAVTVQNIDFDSLN
ncbi:MAG: tripartite tricarboxylate transporter substrate binding protein [Propionibacteriaceae bacterium]|nr:tripartite tricarboxylate transporter substrate binding protein [Propionibacteriaceae bacterium]